LKTRCNLEIPVNAQYIRNLIILAHAVHDHIVHFYHLSALDWVDVVSATEGRSGQGGQRWRKASSGAATGRIQEGPGQASRASSATGQLGIFTNGYWGHPAMKLTPEVNLLAVPLPAGAGSAALRQQDRRHSWLQVAAHPERRRRRRGQPAVVGFAVGADHRTPAGDQGVDRQAQRLRQERLSGRRRCHRRLLCRLDHLRRGIVDYISVPDIPLDGKGTKFAMPGGYIANGGKLESFKPITSFNDKYFTDGVSEASSTRGTTTGRQ
jgi:hydrogenase large subunit